MMMLLLTRSSVEDRRREVDLCNMLDSNQKPPRIQEFWTHVGIKGDFL